MVFNNSCKMQKFFLISLVLGMGSLSVHSEPSEKAVAEASQTFLKNVVREFSHSPEASTYFLGASTENISLKRYAPLVNSPDGWAYVWHYEHDVTYIDNPEVQAVRSPVLGNNAPIIIEIEVVYKFGTGKWFSWSKRYPVLEKPKVETGFYLKTKDNEIQKRLVQKMDDLMKENLITFRKALDNS